MGFAVLHERASLLTSVGSLLVVSGLVIVVLSRPQAAAMAGPPRQASAPGLPSKANPHALAGGSRRRA